MTVYYNTCTFLCGNQHCDKRDGFMCPWIFEHVAIKNCTDYRPVMNFKQIKYDRLYAY